MTFENQILIELIKTGFALFLLVLTWGIGQRIIASWDIRKKRQELDIATTTQFQQLYGEFKEVSKLWKVFLESKDPQLGFPDNTRWDLLKRATAAESKIEAILVKLATERKLDETNLKNLGLFRQAYQQLRESIRDNKTLNFSSYGHEYNYYNDLASKVACLIASGKPLKGLCSDAARANLRAIVSVRGKDLRKELGQFEKDTPALQGATDEE